MNNLKKENKVNAEEIDLMLDSHSLIELTTKATNIYSCIDKDMEKIMFYEWVKNINFVPWCFFKDENEQKMGFDGEYICKLTKFLYV